MNKKNIKLILFAVLFLVSNILITFHNPSVVFAATEAEEAADRNADRACDSDSIGKEYCKAVYRAGYLGKVFPKRDGLNESTGCFVKSGKKCGAVYIDAINERKADFKETYRQICSVMVNTAQGSDHLGIMYKNLKNKDKNKAINACARGFNFGMIDFGKGCQNNYGGRAANDVEFIACLSGMSMADQYIFTGNEARAFAGGDDVSEVGDREGVGGEGQGTEEIQCEASIFSISWIICAVIEFGANFTNWFFNSFLRPLLENIPVSLDPSEGSFRAWQGFRLLANIMLVASMLAIVYAQARGDQ